LGDAIKNVFKKVTSHFKVMEGKIGNPNKNVYSVLFGFSGIFVWISWIRKKKVFA
jgi:hypothetical protein